jgi:chromosome partitioning protein
MILSVVSYKGGCGKTTTAVHLAAYLNSLTPADKAVLLDGDPTRNATAWSRRGAGFLFPVAPVEQLGKLARIHEHLVIDTGQRPSADDLEAAAGGCDLLVIPAVPSALDTDGLGQTIRTLRDLKIENFKVLLTRVAADAGREVDELRKLLAGAKAPMFKAEIPRLKAFEKAAAAGVTVDLVKDPNAARAWSCYEAAGREVMR